MSYRDLVTITVDDAAAFERNCALGGYDDIDGPDLALEGALLAEIDADLFERDIAGNYDHMVRTYGEPHYMNANHPF